MAKTFEVKTMNALRVTAKIAGMESTAKIRSVVSTSSSTSASGVSASRPFQRVDEFLPVEIRRDRKKFAREPEHGIFFRLDGFGLGEKHFHAGENQKHAEQVKHPAQTGG